MEESLKLWSSESLTEFLNILMEDFLKFPEGINEEIQKWFPKRIPREISGGTTRSISEATL